MGNTTLWTIPEVLKFFIPRVLLAVVCGGLIGFEREMKNKPAGIKTNMLICVGASLYTAISILVSASLAESGHFGDPARIAAQIVSGIGFLGGGTIIQSRGTISGLTTAATIWVVSAIGVCIGMGYFNVALFASILVIVVLVMTTAFEDRVFGRSVAFECEIIAEDPLGHVRQAIHQAMMQNELNVDDFDIKNRGKNSIMTIQYSGQRNNHKKFILDIWNIAGIKEIRNF